MLSNVAVILLFSFLFGRSQLVVIKTFDGYAGLHFKETESIRHNKDEWKILINVNLTQCKNELDLIKNNVALIRNCSEEFKMLETAKGYPSRRRDTSLITFISHALSKLNIAMTKYENNYKNMFNNINKDKRFTSNAISELVFNDWSEILIEDEFKKMSLEGARKSTKATKKTSFVSSTLNSMTRSFEQNRDDFITTELSFIQETLSALRNGSENVERLFQIGALIEVVITCQRYMLSSFSMKQEKYGKVVSLVGQRNPIMEADLLRKNIPTNELIQIRDTVSQAGLDLPTKITSENLFSFLSPEVEMVNDQIYICFRIPLLPKCSPQTKILN